MELKVFCKQESVKQMQEIINMNINELVQCWRLATDKTECQASGEDELLQATDGFPEGLGTQLSAGPFPKVLQMHVLEEGKPGGGGLQPRKLVVGAGGTGRVQVTPLPWQVQRQRKLILISSWDPGGTQG